MKLKRIFSFFALISAMFMSASVWAQSWEAPVKPADPVRDPFQGTWVTPVDGGQYYIYNVGAAQFMGCGRDWGTRTITTNDSIASPSKPIKHATDKGFAIPYSVTTVPNKDYLYFSPLSTDMSGYLTGEDNASWQDGDTGRAGEWQVLPVEGLENTFIMHCANVDPYDPNAVNEDDPETEEVEGLDKYRLLGVCAIETSSYTWNDLKVGGFNTAGESHKVNWKFVEATDQVAQDIRDWRESSKAQYDEDVKAYNAAMAIYNARVMLYNTLNEAVAAGADYTAASAVYQKADATEKELLAANTQLLVNVKIATSELPVDITEVLQNPDFEVETFNGVLPRGWESTFTCQYCGQQNRKDTNPSTGLSMTNFIEAWQPSTSVGDGVISQTVYGLPAGVYRLECDASICHDPASGDGSDITGAGLFVQTGTSHVAFPIGTPRLGIEHFILPFINNDGANSVQLGLYAQNTNANWISADNFRLYYVGPLPTIYLEATEVPIKAGESSTIEICLNNANTDLVAFQMDVALPEGVGIDKTGCSLSARITDEDQELTIGKLEDGKYRLTSSSLSLTPISGNDGALLTVKLIAEKGCIGGQATISNIRFSTSNSERVTLDDESFDIAVMYNVIYKVDNQDYKIVSTAYGTNIIAESAPTKEGHTFSGWSEIPETMPANDVVVTGSFSINSYTLTYELDGEVYKSSSIVYGTAITPEEDLSREGYTFSGWSEIPETMPANDVVVTGSFTVNSYTLAYKVDGTDYKTSIVAYGTPLSPETEPTKEGYTFSGWSEIPETMPARDVEVTGNFYLYGDVNTDEEVDVVDVVDIARFVVATPSVMFREKLADLNSDNTVNIADAVVLVNYIAGDQNFVKAMFAPAAPIASNDALRLTQSGKGLSLHLTNGRAYTAFQFDLYVSDDTNVNEILLSAERKQGHQLFYNKVENGHYRVAALSISNHVFQGNAGELLSIEVEGTPDAEVSISNIHFFDTQAHDYAFDELSFDMATGLRDVKVNDNVNDVIYDLQGRKLTKMQRGVNIVNGKKVIVRK